MCRMHAGRSTWRPCCGTGDWPAEDPRAGNVPVTLNLPEGDVWVNAEPTRLELACLNVIRNACEAARGQVVVAVTRAGEYWDVQVDDDGPGISGALRERIFEPFYSTRPAGEGTGLGLAMVKSVVKEHQGRLVVADSEPGGCRMTLSWPAATPPSPTSEVAP